MIVIEDRKGHKFGGLAAEEWETRTDFYGNGESFVYTFKDQDAIEIY